MGTIRREPSLRILSSRLTPASTQTLRRVRYTPPEVHRRRSAGDAEERWTDGEAFTQLPEPRHSRVARKDRSEREADAIRALATLGWTTPVWLDGESALSILGSGDSAAIDSAFVEFYTADSGRMYERISTDLQCWPLRQWQALVDQVDAAYRRGDYAIVVPSALVLLEGVVMRAELGNTDVREAVRSRVQEYQGNVAYWGAAWEALSCFVEGLYGRVDFAGAEPPTINRHWILHGRSSAQWSQADCLRVLQACVVFARLDALFPRSNKRIEQNARR